MGVLLRVVAGKEFQHENNITVFCSKESGNPVEIVLWFLVAGKGGLVITGECLLRFIEPALSRKVKKQ